MKYIIKLIIWFITVGVCFLSCRKKYDADFVGPARESGYSLVEPLKSSSKAIDFTDGDTNLVYFTAKVDRPGTLRLTITGLESFAQKNITFYNTSKIDSSIGWNGSQDSLYYFRTGEKCVVTLSIVSDILDNDVTQQLRDRGEIVSGASVLSRDTITIKKRRNMPKHHIELFPKYPLTQAKELGYNNIYIAAYDIEGGTSIQEEFDDVNLVRVNNLPIVNEHVVNRPDWLPYDPYHKPIRGTSGDRFFILKGTDKVSKVVPKDKPDYYVARLGSPAMKRLTGGNILAYGNPYVGAGTPNFITDSIKHITDPEKLWFNVFVYGNGDGSQINYTVKEIQNPTASADFSDENDEAYQYTIKVNFKGWRLFSVPYSKFTYTEQKDTETGKYKKGTFANKIKEPFRIAYIQFGLVAGTLGGTAQMIIDCPVMSWEGPLQY